MIYDEDDGFWWKLVLWAAMVLGVFLAFVWLVGCGEKDRDTTFITSPVHEGSSAPQWPLLIPSALAQGDVGCNDPVSFLDTALIPLDLADGATAFSEADATGYVEIMINDRGPEDVLVHTRGLSPGTYSVFLTDSADTGQVPAVFLGAFESQNISGVGLRGSIHLRVEVIDAYIGTNPDPLDSGLPPGAIVSGAEKLELRHLRIYEGRGELSVFSACVDGDGGRHAFSTADELP